MEKQRGFTLIEIAIVMVIIGLLLGGVLKGQEMITNAKVKRIIKDFDGLSAAILTYQDRYRTLPGDDPDADGRFDLPGTAAENNGNGNGVVEGPWNDMGTAVESRRLWLHLRGSGLIAGQTKDGADSAGGDQEINPYGGLIGVDGENLGLTGIVACMGAIPGKAAAIVDIQIDDGEPDTGRVRVKDQSNYDGADPSSDAYTAANEDTAMTLCRTL